MGSTCRFSSQSISCTRRPRVSLRSPSRDDYKCYSCRQFCHFARECSDKDTSADQVQHIEERASKHKGCFHLYEEGLEEEHDSEEGVIAVMCHSGKTYSDIQPNRENEEHYK